MFYLNGHAPLLLVDPDTRFLSRINQQPYASLAEPRTAKSHQEARSLLIDNSLNFSGIFINFKLPEIEVVSLVHTVHQLHIGTPLFALFDQDVPATFTRHLRKLGFLDSLHKPMSFTDLMAVVAPMTQEELNLNDSKSANTSHVEFSALDFEFTQINTNHLQANLKCLFDVYEKIAPGRYIKKSVAGMAFDHQELQNCLDRGVSHLYVLKQDQRAYLDYCENLFAALSRKDDPSSKDNVIAHEVSGFVLLQQEQL